VNTERTTFTIDGLTLVGTLAMAADTAPANRPGVSYQ
jgi:hypothetical protein